MLDSLIKFIFPYYESTNGRMYTIDLDVVEIDGSIADSEFKVTIFPSYNQYVLQTNNLFGAVQIHH